MTARTKNEQSGFRRACGTRSAVPSLSAVGCRRTVFSVSANGVFAESYAYDALGHRTCTTSRSTTNHQPSTVFHAYDSVVGNRLSTSVDGELTAYAANALNQYSNVTCRSNGPQPDSLSPAYDLNGNMTWDGTNACFWDLQNQLVLVSNAAYLIVNALLRHGPPHAKDCLT